MYGWTFDGNNAAFFSAGRCLGSGWAMTGPNGVCDPSTNHVIAEPHYHAYATQVL
jgi:hypothetical protein